MNSLLGIVALMLPFIFITEIRKSKKYKIFVVVAAVILLYLGLDKIYRDEKKDETYNLSDSAKTKKIDNLLFQVTNMNERLAANAKNNFDFLHRLDSMYHIKRNTNNYPFKIYNNTVNNPTTVNFDQR